MQMDLWMMLERVEFSRVVDVKATILKKNKNENKIHFYF